MRGGGRILASERADQEGGILLLDLEDLYRAVDSAPGLTGAPEAR